MPKLEISKVHDAYAAGGECPLCPLMDAVEQTYLESFHGGRVMDPGVRVRTNETGFCPGHYRALYRGVNKLGLALVVHTHLRKKLPELRETFEAFHGAAASGRKGEEKLGSLAQSLGALRDRCYICEMLAIDLERYAFTIIYLWKKDPEFLPVFRASQGFCIGHFLTVFAKARELLRGDELERWLRDVVPLVTASLERLEEEVLAFTQLHKDSNRSLGTEEERTALARTLQKLAGSVMKHD